MPNRRRYPRSTSARIIASWLDVAIGVRLLMPDDILGGNPGYSLIRAIFYGDVPFGLITVVCGTVGVAAMFSTRLTWPAVITYVVSLAVWSTTSIALFWVNVGQIGSLAYIAIAATNGFALAHSARWQWQQKNPKRRDG